jgi:hypothetical protein
MIPRLCTPSTRAGWWRLGMRKILILGTVITSRPIFQNGRAASQRDVWFDVKRPSTEGRLRRAGNVSDAARLPWAEQRGMLLRPRRR